MIDEPQCLADHMGLYCCEPRWLAAAIASIRSGGSPRWGEIETARAEDGSRDDRSAASLFRLSGDGVAVISVVGPMTKGLSKFGGTSTIRTRRALRAARANADVRAVVLHVDSPGGHVAGTAELAADVRATDAAVPVLAHISDLGASAAYWVASQARGVRANETGEVGSIGTVALVLDTSDRAKAEGVTVHVVATGAHKGAFADGAPVDSADLDVLRERVLDLNDHFVRAVSSGRALADQRLGAVITGRVWIAAKARKLGLIDRVQNLDETIAEAGEIASRGRRAPRRRRAAATLDILERE